MKIFLIGLIVILIFGLMLYIGLGYLYDLLAHKENKIKLRKQMRKQKKELDLKMAKLIVHKSMIEYEIKVKTESFGYHADIKDLEGELEKVNRLIDKIRIGDEI